MTGKQEEARQRCESLIASLAPEHPARPALESILEFIKSMILPAGIPLRASSTLPVLWTEIRNGPEGQKIQLRSCLDFYILSPWVDE